MSRRLSLVVLMFIVALVGYSTGVSYLGAQLVGFRSDRDVFITTILIVTILPAIFAPAWLSLSDAIGRNPVMQLSFVGLLLYQTALLFNSTPMLVFGMVIYGITSCGFGCYHAYISDQDSKNRAEIFAITLAAWTLGFVCASYTQEILYRYDTDLFVYSGILVIIIAIVLTQFVLPGSLDADKKRPFDLKSANIIGSLRLLFSNRATAMLTVAIVLYFLATRALANVQSSFYMARHESARELAEMINAQQLSTVLFAVMTFVLILTTGKNKSTIISLIMAMIGMLSLAYTTFELERITFLLPQSGIIAGCIMLAMVFDKTDANKYGLAVGGITGLTAVMDLISTQNPKLFEYFKNESPQNLFLCAVIPAVLILVSLLIYIRADRPTASDRYSGTPTHL